MHEGAKLLVKMETGNDLSVATDIVDKKSLIFNL